MSDPGNWTGWTGFKPDTTAVPVEPVEPVTPKKSSQDQLDELEDEISKLEDRRKELLFEVAKEEVLEDEDGTLHKDCASKEDLESAEAAAEEANAEEADFWDALREFGGHRPSCLEGALAGTQKLHRLCTCGWNEVATELERA